MTVLSTVAFGYQYMLTCFATLLMVDRCTRSIGVGGYSDVAMLGSDTAAVLFEKGGPGPRSKTVGGCELALATFNIQGIVDAGPVMQ